MQANLTATNHRRDAAVAEVTQRSSLMKRRYAVQYSVLLCADSAPSRLCGDWLTICPYESVDSYAEIFASAPSRNSISSIPRSRQCLANGGTSKRPTSFPA